MFQKRKLNFANLLLVVKRDEKRKQLRWHFGGIDRGSQVLTPGRGLSNNPVGRGGTTTPIPIPFLQALFYTFIFSSTNGPKNGCLEKEMAGNPE